MMKKIFYLAALVLGMAVAASCEKDGAGGTATEKTAGEWYVTVVAVEADGTESTEVFDDLEIPTGPFIVRTFNTEANKADMMYISDISYFSEGLYAGAMYGEFAVFGFYAPIDVNPSSKTFQSDGWVDNMAPNYDFDYYGYAEYGTIKISNGKIVKDGGKQKNGSTADSIEFDLEIADDYWQLMYNAEYPTDFPTTAVYAEYGVDHFHFKGVRYSGLVENE